MLLFLVHFLIFVIKWMQSEEPVVEDEEDDDEDDDEDDKDEDDAEGNFVISPLISILILCSQFDQLEVAIIVWQLTYL